MNEQKGTHSAQSMHSNLMSNSETAWDICDQCAIDSSCFSPSPSYTQTHCYYHYYYCCYYFKTESVEYDIRFEGSLSVQCTTTGAGKKPVHSVSF